MSIPERVRVRPTCPVCSRDVGTSNGFGPHPFTEEEETLFQSLHDLLRPDAERDSPISPPFDPCHNIDWLTVRYAETVAAIMATRVYYRLGPHIAIPYWHWELGLTYYPDAWFDVIGREAEGPVRPPDDDGLPF